MTDSLRRPIDCAAERLAQGNDTILLQSPFREGQSEDKEAALRFAMDCTDSLDHYPFGAIERDDQDCIVLLYEASPNEGSSVVAVLSGSACLACAVTDNEMEANALYGGAAEEAGIMSGECLGCSQPIPNVYEYCIPCMS